jgi:hypothetical protein
MTETGGNLTLDPDTRILHVLTESAGVVAEVARIAIRRHLTAGLKVAVASRDAVFADLDLPADPNLVHIDVPVRSGLRPGDVARTFTLHQHYRHIDVVHAHGLHAAALAGLAMTGLPAHLRPALVATVGRFSPDGAIDSAEAAIVARWAAVVLGTTDPVCEHFVDEVPIVERAELLRPDIETVWEARRTRREVREDLGLPAGTLLIAAPVELVDHDPLTTIVEAALQLRERRPDRQWAVALTGAGRLRAVIGEEVAVRRRDIILADGVSTVDIVSAADLVLASERMTAIDAEGIMQLARPTVFVGTERAGRVWGEAVPQVDSTDTRGLLREINRLIDDPAARARTALAGKRRVIDVDGADLVAGDLLDVYAAALPAAR